MNELVYYPAILGDPVDAGYEMVVYIPAKSYWQAIDTINDSIAGADDDSPFFMLTPVVLDAPVPELPATH